ncbi:ABC transporter ATP-binding protein [Streptomyces sp. NPDC054884]|uniref:ABC transporter ATP-binding protein n=1 Tax=Streptomyces sp. ME08-AFT2 TaxID=3028683 RepID=UPI0029AB9D25|nr:ABC transporter ATP-binding protein [Streptomyces sp. ME08-AFT2]MDX3312767.1 ABC transporter ATP-binding protein [Streptomyces sp. ME08-AFT2]
MFLTDVRTLVARALHALRLTWEAGRVTTSLYLVITVAQGAVPAGIALLAKWLIDGVQHMTSGEGGPKRVPMPALTPLQAVVCIGVLTAVQAALPPIAEYLKSRLQRGVSLLVQYRLYSAVSRLEGLAPFERPDFLDRLRMAQQAAVTAPEQIVASCFGLLQAGLTVFGFLGVLIAISPLMALITVIAVLPALFLQMSLSRQRSEMMWQTSPRTRRRLFYQRLLFDLDAVKETRLFGTSRFLLERMSDETKEINRAEESVDRRTVTRHVPLSTLSAVVAALGLVWIVMAATRGEFSLGDVSAFIAAVAGVQSALGAAIADAAAAYHSLLIFGHYQEVSESESDLPKPSDPQHLPSLRHGIRLEDVWFRYRDDGPWVLRGVTLTIPFGRSLALVGINGAGKSTLVKLLCRMYDPTKGRITWDGVDIRDVEAADLRERISAVFQDFTCYDLSVAENIAMGDLHFIDDEQEIRAAAEEAGVHTHISSLPRGYRTMLSRVFYQEDESGEKEAGVTLSGGQWQRIALARALLRSRRDLLILDEPSSGLDAAAEQEVHEQLRRYRVNATSVLISHRLGTVRHADRIVVVHNGQVVEEGAHEQLMDQCGEYARLFSLQASDYTDSTA